MEDNTFDLNDLPEEVLNEIAEGEVFEIELEEPAPVVEELIEAPVVEEKPSRKRKKSDNEIIDELVIEAEKKVVNKRPGMYHNGRRIEKVTANLGKKWTVVIGGKREKVLKSEIEIVK